MVPEKRLLKAILICCESLAVAALFSTKDILPIVLVIFGTAWVILNLVDSWVPKSNLITGCLLLFGIVPATIVLHRTFQLQPLETAAQIVLLLQLTMFFLPNPDRAKHFRLGNTFVMTSIAAGLSPEFVTGVAILLYFAVTFIALILQFVLDFSGIRLSDLREYGRSRAFAFLFTGTAAFLMITAAVFPTIPRVRVGRFVQAGTLGRLGFSGEVDLQSKADITQESAVALRIEIPQESKVRDTLLSKEYLKARNLDSFDGRSWYSSPSRIFRKENLDTSDPNAPTVIIQRESINVPLLPIFYGSKITEILGNRDQAFRLQKAKGGVYRLHGSSRNRVIYRATLSDSNNAPVDVDDAPLAINSSTRIGVQEFEELLDSFAQQIFRKERRPGKLISRLENFFKQQRFKYSLEPLTETVSSGYERFEKFLTTDRKGHCELFATAAALLLRRAGVPTRIAAGFRIPEIPGNRYLVLRNSDAHVWVEVWDRDRSRWIVYDPTPPLNIPLWQQLYQQATSIKDDLEASWYRYVVDSQELKLKDFAAALFGIAIERRWPSAVLFIAALLWVRGMIRRRRKRLIEKFGILPRPELLRLSLLLDRLQRHQSPEISSLRQTYETLRFARPRTEEEFQKLVQEALNTAKRLDKSA